jgi:hypothetical protein
MRWVHPMSHSLLRCPRLGQDSSIADLCRAGSEGASRGLICRSLSLRQCQLRSALRTVALRLHKESTLKTFATLIELTDMFNPTVVLKKDLPSFQVLDGMGPIPNLAQAPKLLLKFNLTKVGKIFLNLSEAAVRVGRLQRRIVSICCGEEALAQLPFWKIHAGRSPFLTGIFCILRPLPHSQLHPHWPVHRR